MKILTLSLFASLAFIIALSDRAPHHAEDKFSSPVYTERFQSFVNNIVSGDATGPHRYRIMAPFLLFGLSSLTGIDMLTVDFFLKFIILVLIQVQFFRLLSSLYPTEAAIAGVFLLDVITMFGLSYFLGQNSFETSDLLDLLAVILAIRFLHSGDYIKLSFVLFLASFNRETVLFLCIPIVLLNYKKPDWKTSTVLLSSIIPYLGIRVIMHSGSFDVANTDLISHNLPFILEHTWRRVIIANIRTVVLLAPLIALSLYNFRSQTELFRALFWIVPPFIITHYLVGDIIESRRWLPLFPILIPMALNTLRHRLREGFHIL